MEELPHRGDAAIRLLQTGQPGLRHGDVDGVDENESLRPSERLHYEGGQPVATNKTQDGGSQPNMWYSQLRNYLF